jgi:hypothetical protein
MPSHPPTLRAAALALALTLALASGCATAGLTPVTPTQPVARMQMRPEYRVFYDSLKDLGEWVLIEPLGFVFRPRVAWNQWQPYSDGFWAPTDAYGWVWISAEPFGWATDHYGEWLYDRFQGWVWAPGLDWAPAWVTWQVAGNYVGWSPMVGHSSQVAAGGSLAPVPAAATHYAPLSQLGATDLTSRMVGAAQVGSALSEARAVKNLDKRDGVTFNRGPSMELVEEARGPVTTVRVEDLVPVDLGRRAAAAPASKPGTEPAGDAEDPIAITRRAAERATTEARRLTAGPVGIPESLPVVRPALRAEGGASGAPASAPHAAARGKSAAPADTSR